MVALAAVCSKVMVLLLSIHCCLMLLPLCVNFSCWVRFVEGFWVSFLGRDSWFLKFALTLKAPRKNASENVVCLSHLLQIIA